MSSKMTYSVCNKNYLIASFEMYSRNLNSIRKGASFDKLDFLITLELVNLIFKLMK